jgi:LysW-gamma-L-lysine/LysW-L-ornithine aminotransferase
MTDFRAIEDAYDFSVYNKRGVVLVRGVNARVWDDQGREYIDCVAGHGVAGIGHCNPRIIEALQSQSHRLLSCSATFHNDARAGFLARLMSVVPPNLKRAFLCNSGTEAIEAAIKFARFSTRRTDFVCAMRGFHGRTMGAMSATYNPDYRTDFEPIVPGFHYAPFNNFEKLREKVDGNTAGVILEIVQGEGGVHVGNADYFTQVRRLCDETGMLLIIDEVQTGFCRTGRMFASNHFALEPDILCVAKAIAGGLPMGAAVCADKVRPPAGKHGSTFGGNPLVCAAANAALDFMIEHKLAEQAMDKGEYFVTRLKQQRYANVREIRHLGLMVGIELKEKGQPYLARLMEEGVLAMPAGVTVMRFLPPLTISREELDIVAEKVAAVLPRL